MHELAIAYFHKLWLDVIIYPLISSYYCYPLGVLYFVVPSWIKKSIDIIPFIDVPKTLSWHKSISTGSYLTLKCKKLTAIFKSRSTMQNNRFIFFIAPFKIHMLIQTTLSSALMPSNSLVGLWKSIMACLIFYWDGLMMSHDSHSIRKIIPELSLSFWH